MKSVFTAAVLAKSTVALVEQSQKPAIYGECGGNYAGVRGHLASPGFPFKDYPADQNCEWIIEVPTNLFVEIDIVWMDLEPDPAGCRFDALSIKGQDGHQLLQRTCGSKMPFPTVVNDSRVIINFKSDEAEQKTGFALNWRAIEPPRDEFDCNFERGYCQGWSHDAQADFTWELNRGATQTNGTGPVTDHSTGDQEGVYTYIEGSLPNMPGDRAVLVSPVVPPSSLPRCLTFWYHMHGNGVGELEIQQKSASKEAILFQEAKNKGPEWLEALIELEPIDESSRIRFVGTVGKRFESDIAIDDIALLPGPCTAKESEKGLCGENEYMCASGKNCIPNEYLCDGTTDCEDNDDELICRNGFLLPFYLYVNLADKKTIKSESEKVTVLKGNHTLEVHQLESVESKTHYCGVDEYQCAGNNGCVPIGWLCDGQPDCQNGDDENGCPVKLQRFYDRLKVESTIPPPAPTIKFDETTESENVTDITTSAEVTTDFQEVLVTAQNLESITTTQENEHDFYQTTEQVSLLLDEEIDIIIELGKHPKSVIYAGDSVESDASGLKLHLFGLFLLCLLI